MDETNFRRWYKDLLAPKPQQCWGVAQKWWYATTVMWIMSLTWVGMGLIGSVLLIANMIVHFLPWTTLENLQHFKYLLSGYPVIWGFLGCLYMQQRADRKQEEFVNIMKN